MSTWGMVLAGVGALAIASAPSAPLLYAGRALSGLGLSVLFVAVARVVADWFEPGEFSTLSGLSSGVSHVGAVVATIPLAWAIERFSWRPTASFIGAMSLAMAAVSWWSVRDRAKATRLTFHQLPPAIASVVRNPHTWPPMLVFVGLYAPYLAFTGTWGIAYLMHVYDLTRE